MLTLYRWLLYLYPAAYREEYGDEMAGVFCEAQSAAKKDFLPQASFFLREAAGVLSGVLQEYWRAVVGRDSSAPLWSSYLCSSSLSLSRRFAMRSGFRFPKSTAALMAIILAGVVLAIEKAKSILASAGEPGYPDLFGGVVIVFLAACVLAVVGWAVLFAARRSGVHRLAEMSPTVAGEKTRIRPND